MKKTLTRTVTKVAKDESGRRTAEVIGTFTAGSQVAIMFNENRMTLTGINSMTGEPMTCVCRSARYPFYFSKTGKAPSEKSLEKMLSDGIAKTVTGHRTEPDGYGPDGSPSWFIALGLI